MTEQFLFDVPPEAYVIPPEPEELTRGERRKRLVATRIATGIHPLGRPVLLHADANRDPEDRATGPRCGTCVFRVLLSHHDKTYPKCWYPSTTSYPHPRDTHSDSSDIRAWWPACSGWQPKEDDDAV
jgi:hypothetical protein